MNTKIFIILLALLSLFSQKISAGATSQKQALHAQNHELSVNTPTGKHHDNKNRSESLDWSYEDVAHSSQHQSDDDNKSHHFHYERLWKHRNRILFSILFKILLTITHICSLLCATIHLMH